MKLNDIDNGNEFDFGRTSDKYAKYRDIYPQSMYEKAVVVGEIGLAGEIRSVSQAQRRVNEAVRLGFDRIILPFHNLKGVQCEDAELIGVRNIREAYEAVIK